MRHPKSKGERRAQKARYDAERDFSWQEEETSKYKPKAKSRILCLGCHKEKLQFETRAKAERFMAFNAETIARASGYAPVRAYWCYHCGCWHVTSQEKRKYAA